MAASEELSDSVDIEDLYSKAEIAFLTGWTFEYIENLGIVDRMAILQIHEAKQKLAQPKRNRKGK